MGVAVRVVFGEAGTVWQNVVRVVKLGLRLFFVLMTTLMGATKIAAQERQIGPSGLLVPRFVSTKSNPVNVRHGPGRDYEIAWIFVKPGVPLEIVAEFDNWRKIRDPEGEEGWVFHSLLSGRRTAVVMPEEQDAHLALRQSRSETAPVTAFLEPGLIAPIESCIRGWCRLKADGYDGWIERSRIWGAYEDEIVPAP